MASAKAPVFGVVQGRLIQSPPGQLQWFPQEAWESEFFLAKALGFNYIELIAERNHNAANPLWTDEGCERIQRVAAENGLLLHAFCNDYIVDHALPGSAEVLDQNLRLISRGKKLGMQKYILPFFEASELTMANAEAYLAPLRRMADVAGDAGILLCLETVLNAKELGQLLERLNHPNIKVVFDTGNRIAFGHDIYGDIRALGDAIRHVHIKDKNSSNANVLLGTGEVDFLKVFQSLKAIQYDGPYTFETFRGADALRTARYHRQFAEFFFTEAYGA